MPVVDILELWLDFIKRGTAVLVDDVEDGWRVGPFLEHCTPYSTLPRGSPAPQRGWSIARGEPIPHRKECLMSRNPTTNKAFGRPS